MLILGAKPIFTAFSDAQYLFHGAANHALEEGRRLASRAVAAGARVSRQDRLGGVPEVAQDDGVVLARVDLVVMRDFADVLAVDQEAVDGGLCVPCCRTVRRAIPGLPGRDRLPPAASSRRGEADLADHAGSDRSAAGRDAESAG